MSKVIPKKIYVKMVLRRCSAQRAQSTQNAPETHQKSDQKFDQFLHRFFNDFSSNLAAFWPPFGRQNRLKRGAAERVKGSFATTARRTRPGVPPERQNERPRPPQDPKMELQGYPKTLKMIPKVAQGHPKTPAGWAGRHAVA